MVAAEAPACQTGASSTPIVRSTVGHHSITCVRSLACRAPVSASKRFAVPPDCSCCQSAAQPVLGDRSQFRVLLFYMCHGGHIRTGRHHAQCLHCQRLFARVARLVVHCTSIMAYKGCMQCNMLQACCIACSPCMSWVAACIALRAWHG
jgi:hypothetical protein